ncbi:MAG: diguanylate cyclase [Desulfobacterales bacterium]|nr:diguanylate cyclase [Desulfobacterales bacterium]
MLEEKNIKILYVEDEKITQLILKKMIKEHGLPYDIYVAGNLKEAMEAFKNNIYDIILLDYMLPDGTGLDILEKIKDTPTIFLTASNDATIAVNAIKSGARDYFVKDRVENFVTFLKTTIDRVLYTVQLEKSKKEVEQEIIKKNEELARLYEKAKELSLHDPLTGLANRRQLDIVFNKAFARAKRYNRPISVIMIDIDYFKRYNDTYGHAEGDKLLVKFAETIKNNLREADLAARYGGEEFMVILPDTELRNASLVAEKLKSKILGNTSVSASFGVSSYNESIPDKEAIIKKADAALYRAKQNGRNRVEVEQ